MAYQIIGAKLLELVTTTGGRAVVTQGTRTVVATTARGQLGGAAGTVTVLGGAVSAAQHIGGSLAERIQRMRKYLEDQVLVSAPRNQPHPGSVTHRPSGVEAVIDGLLTIGKPTVEALANSLNRQLNSGSLSVEPDDTSDEDSRNGRLVLPCMFPVRTFTATRPVGPALAAEASDWVDGLTAVAPNVPTGSTAESAAIFAVSGGHAGRIDALRYRSAVVGDLQALIDRARNPNVRNSTVSAKSGVVARTTHYHLEDSQRQKLLEAGAIIGRAVAAHGRCVILLDPDGPDDTISAVQAGDDGALRFEWNLNDGAFAPLGMLLVMHRIARSATLAAVGGGDGRAIMAALDHDRDPDQRARVALALSLCGLSAHELSALLVAGAEQYAMLWTGLSQALGLQVPLDPVGDVLALKEGGTVVARPHVRALEATTVPALRGDTFEPCDVIASVKRVVGDGLFVPQRADFMPDRTRDLPASYSAGRRIHIRPGAVHSIVGHSGAGKTTLTRTMCQVLRAEFGDKLRVVLIDCSEPLHNIPTSALASALFEMDVEVVQLERAHPGLIDMVQLHLLERYPEHHIALILDSATGLLSESLGGGSGTVGASEGGVNPLARPGLTALSRLVHPAITTMALYNAPSTRNIMGGYWPQIHGASTMSYLLDRRQVVGFRDRIGNTMFQHGGPDGQSYNMIGEFVSRSALSGQRGMGDDTRYTG